MNAKATKADDKNVQDDPIEWTLSIAPEIGCVFISRVRVLVAKEEGDVLEVAV